MADPITQTLNRVSAVTGMTVRANSLRQIFPEAFPLMSAGG